MLRELISVGGEIASSAAGADGRDASELIDEADHAKVLESRTARAWALAELGRIDPAREELDGLVDALVARAQGHRGSGGGAQEQGDLDPRSHDLCTLS